MENCNDVSTVYLLAGGNLNNTQQKYDKLFTLLEQSAGRIVKKSAFYSSPPWGYSSLFRYVNVALCLLTHLNPKDLLTQTQHIEFRLGRNRSVPSTDYQDRTMDIDILLYEDMVYVTDELTIPHLRMRERNFVLTPLAEIASRVKDPISGLSVHQLQQACPDKSPVTKCRIEKGLNRG
jgi:2-amino-4-hydroxy-6-hydroxymethyldihydropteridine diphosphokinase